MKLRVKKSTLIFGFTAVLGLAFLIFFFIVSYLGRTYSSEILIIEALIPVNTIFGYFWVHILVVGTGLLTVGILGIGRQRIQNKRRLFIILTVAFTPNNSMYLVFFNGSCNYLSRIKRSARRMAITNVSVTNTNPLILSLNAKSFYMAEIWFDQAYVKNCNQNNVASIIGEMVEV